MENTMTVMGKITIQTTDLNAPIINTTIYEIEDVPLNDTELNNLIGFLLEAKNSSLEPEVAEEAKPSIIIPGDK